MKKTIISGTVGALVAGSALFSAVPGNTHGWVSFPLSRAEACNPSGSYVGAPLNSDCGPAMYEPFSLEAPKGFPENPASPVDGHLASTGDSRWGTKLDEQSPTRWYHNELHRGDNTFTWSYHAPHRTSQWRYFMTKQGWDQNKPFTRADLELIETVSNNCEAEKCDTADNYPRSHDVTIPDDRSGYHVVYAIWDVSDTINAFYQAIDVDVK